MHLPGLVPVDQVLFRCLLHQIEFLLVGGLFLNSKSVFLRECVDVFRLELVQLHGLLRLDSLLFSQPRININLTLRGHELLHVRPNEWLTYDVYNFGTFRFIFVKQKVDQVVKVLAIHRKVNWLLFVLDDLEYEAK